MKNSLLILTAISLAAVTGCKSPVFVQQDDAADLSTYNTYAWVPTHKNEKDERRRSGYADVAIHNAVNAELKDAGWREVSDNPDVLVSYDVLVERSVERQSDPVYSQPFTRVFYNPYRRRWGTIYYPSQFLGFDSYNRPVKEGTVTITMMDARTDKTVWQAWTTERLNYSRMTSDELSKGVRNIFRKFDVAMR